MADIEAKLSLVLNSKEKLPLKLVCMKYETLNFTLNNYVYSICWKNYDYYLFYSILQANY